MLTLGVAQLTNRLVPATATPVRESVAPRQLARMDGRALAWLSPKWKTTLLLAFKPVW